MSLLRRPSPGTSFRLAGLAFMVAASLLVTTDPNAQVRFPVGVAAPISLAFLVVGVVMAVVGCVLATRQRHTLVRVIAAVVGGGVWLFVSGYIYPLIAAQSIGCDNWTEVSAC